MHPPDATNKPVPLPLQPVTESNHVSAPLVLAGGTVLGAEPAPAGPPGLSAPPTLSALMLALRRRWLLALCVATLGTAAIVAGLCFLFPAHYAVQAHVKLALYPRNPLISGYGVANPHDAPIWKANQEGILKGRLVLTRALASKKVAGLSVSQVSVEWLEKALKVDYLLGPEIMRITLSGDDSEGLAPLLNSVVDSYLEEVEQQEAGKRNEVLRQLEESQKSYQHKLYRAESDLRKEETALGIDQPLVWKAKYDQAQQQLSEARKQHQALLGEIARKQRELAALDVRDRNYRKEPVPSARVERELQDHPSVKVITKQLEEMELLIQQTRDAVPVNQQEKALRPLLGDRDGMVKGYEAVCNRLRPLIEERVRVEIREGLKADMVKLAAEIDTLRFQEKDAANVFRQADDEFKKLDPANQPRTPLLEKLRHDTEQIKEGLAKVQKAIADLKVEPPSDPRALRMQSAVPPTGLDYSRQIKVAGAGGVAAFGLLLFGVSFWEFRSRKVGAASDVVRGLGMNLVGTLPVVPGRGRGPVSSSTSKRDLHWQSLVTESIDAVRTMILHLARAEGLHVVMITSAVGGEGKTSVASQLAASLARAWRKTLLVDGDLRNPAVHKLFNLSAEPGLSEVLRGEATVQDVVQPTSLSRLWVVPAGHWDAHALQALAQDGIGQLLAQFKEQYDFVIIDSCPVLPVADSLLLAQHVDAVVFSVLKDVSRLPMVQAARAKLGALGVRTLGAVVIGDDPASIAYQYPSQ